MSDDNVTNNEGGGDDPFAALVGEGKKFGVWPAVFRTSTKQATAA